MKAWRALLSAFLMHQGFAHAEVDLESLHWLGWRGEATGPFLRAAYAAQSPFAAICVGFGTPFTLTFELTNDNSLRSSRGGFVLLFDEEKKHLALGPLSHLNTRELPREPFYPRTMGGARIPVQMSWSLALDNGSGQRWINIRDGMSHVGISVVLRPLLSGDVALALSEEGPRS